MISVPDFKQKQIAFIYLNYDEKMSIRNDNIVVKNKDGKIIHQSTCYKLFTLFVAGNINITTALLQKAKEFGFSIILLNFSLRPYSIINAYNEGNYLLRKKQYSYSGLEIAKRIILNKVKNQLTVLKNIRNKTDDLKTDINKIEGYIDSINQPNIELTQLLGYEGLSSKLYFKHLFANCNWISRKPRVKHDMVNTMLDIGYTKLFNIIDAMLSSYGFDTFKGVLHQEFYNRKSLVCDLVEPFRPIIDLKIRKAYNLGQIKSEDFVISQNQYLLIGKKAIPYSSMLLKELLDYKLSIFSYIQSYYRFFMKEHDFDRFPFFDIESKKDADN